nr:hypothetical protein BaRGS_034273 [Batillaria attramentaria]
MDRSGEAGRWTVLERQANGPFWRGRQMDRSGEAGRWTVLEREADGPFLERQANGPFWRGRQMDRSGEAGRWTVLEREADWTVLEREADGPVLEREADGPFWRGRQDPEEMDPAVRFASSPPQQVTKRGPRIAFHILLATLHSQFPHRQQVDGNSQQNHTYSPISKTSRIN